jgi:hypothetical protein
MLNSKISAVLGCAILAHVLLFVVSFIFIGLAATLALSIIGSCVWIIYCACKENPLTDEDSEDSEDNSAGSADVDEATLPMAVIGGPLCWLLCPTCLLPFAYGKTMKLGFGWNLAAGILRSFSKSVLKLLRLLYDYGADVYVRALASSAKGKQ